MQDILEPAAFPEGKERNRALGLFAGASGSGFAAGITLGWRWVFDINVPIGLAVSDINQVHFKYHTTNL